MSGIPRSASVIASGQSGKAGHAIAVKLRGSTYLGCCRQLKLVNKCSHMKQGMIQKNILKNTNKIKQTNSIMKSQKGKA